MDSCFYALRGVNLIERSAFCGLSVLIFSYALPARGSVQIFPPPSILRNSG